MDSEAEELRVKAVFEGGVDCEKVEGWTMGMEVVPQAGKFGVKMALTGFELEIHGRGRFDYRSKPI